MITDSLATYLQEHAITQDEREAVIILILIIMYADKRLTLDENATLHRYESIIRWESDISLSDFFSNRISEIRTAMRTDNKLSELIQHTCARIKNEEVKTLAINACNDMAVADQFKDDEERFLITAIVNTLQG